MKEIVVKVNDSSLIEYGIDIAKSKVIENIFSILNNDKFIYYIGKRISDATIHIAHDQTSNIGSDVMSSSEISTYLSGFNTEINNNVIYIYNDSVIDVSTKKMSEKTRANYPLRLSLAKLIEYGFGYTGWLNTEPLPNDWQYDVNEHGYKGWYYEDNAGQLHWTNGMEGRLVFLKLCWWLEENFTDVVYRYLKNEL